MKVDAIKDGPGNVVISEDSFEMLLNCLDNQKFIGELSENQRSENQRVIDDYNGRCRDILNQKYVFGVTHDGLSLYKRYEHQNENTEWTGNDVGLVYELFKDTVIKYEKSVDLLPLDGSEVIKEGSEPIGKTKDGWIVVEPEPEPRPWLIERPIRCENEFLTISEDGFKNRPWTQEEVENITKLFNK